jgi:hypothetical protein
MRYPSCLYILSPTNFWMPELVFMQIGMYIMAPEPTSGVKIFFIYLLQIYNLLHSLQ